MTLKKSIRSERRRECLNTVSVEKENFAHNFPRYIVGRHEFFLKSPLIIERGYFRYFNYKYKSGDQIDER